MVIRLPLNRHFLAVPSLNSVSLIIFILNLVFNIVVLFELCMTLVEMLVISLLLKILPLYWRCNLIVTLVSKLRGLEFCLLIVGLYAFPH